MQDAKTVVLCVVGYLVLIACAVALGFLLNNGQDECGG